MSWLSFRGRISRKGWWLGYVLPAWVIIILAVILDMALGLVEVKGGPSADVYGFDFNSGIGPITIIAYLLMIWPILAGSAKRWHDRDKSGWWILINFIPFIGAIWALIETGFLRGTMGPNRFGPDPLMPAGAQWQGGYPQQQYGAPPQAYGQPPGGYAAPPQGYPPQGGYAPQQPPPGYGQPPPPPAYGQQAGGYQPPPQPPPPGSGWDQPQQPQKPGWGQPPPPQGPWGGQR